MTIKSNLEIEEENKKTQLEDFKDKLQKLEIDSINDFTEAMTSILPDENLIDPELITCRLFRVDKMNSNLNQTFVDDLDINNPITEKDIGLGFGGGIYKIITTIRIRNPKNPDTTIKLTHKNSYYQLDKNIWDARKRENDELNQMSHITRVKDFESRALGNNQNQNNNSNDALLNFVSAQLVQSQNMVLALINNKQQSNPLDLGGIAALLEQLKPKDDFMSQMIKPMFESMIKKRDVTPQSDFLKQFKEFKNIMGEVQNVTEVKEIEESITDKFLKQFIPALPDIAEALLSRKAAFFPGEVAQNLKPYEKEIALINSNPEVKAVTVNTLKKNGFTDDQIKTIGKRAKVDLMQEVQEENGGGYEF